MRSSIPQMRLLRFLHFYLASPVPLSTFFVWCSPVFRLVQLVQWQNFWCVGLFIRELFSFGWIIFLSTNEVVRYSLNCGGSLYCTYALTSAVQQPAQSTITYQCFLADLANCSLLVLIRSVECAYQYIQYHDNIAILAILWHHQCPFQPFSYNVLLFRIVRWHFDCRLLHLCESLGFLTSFRLKDVHSWVVLAFDMFILMKPCFID